VQGEKWKIDCSGWLLEDGKGTLMESMSRPWTNDATAIDRLLPED